jgi:glutamate-1-semialdehyde 2,1-aminomutase
MILEPEKGTPPENDFLHKVKQICHENGSVFILDEMITGFRWANGGGQEYHNIEADLSTFGKAIGNGFSISALVGKKELMDLGGIKHNKNRVFLLSLTHGAESGSLAAGLATMKIYQNEPVIEHLWHYGKKLSDLVLQSVSEHNLEGFVDVIGKPCCLVYSTSDQDKSPSQAFRTLFLQETIRRGLLAPSLIVSYSHGDAEISQIGDIIHEALYVYRKALDEGIEKYLEGRPVKPVWRERN